MADTYNRRTVIILAHSVPLLATAGVLAAIASNQLSLAILYAVVFVTGLAAAFESPARQALLPIIVPRHLLARAIGVTSVVMSLSMVTGPTLSGVLIAWQGMEVAYIVHGAILLAGMATMFALQVPPISAGARGGVRWQAIKEGLEFVRYRPVLLGAMTLDMFAVIFGGARALLPIYAVDILQVGPAGYGLLSASMQAGAFLMALALIVLPIPRQTGRTLLFSVAAFGVATVLFGLSRSFALSLVAYMAVGMADQLSVVLRQTTIQLSTPDELRGRVTAVSSIFVNASNQLGLLESGLVAALTNATFSVVSGGLACLGVVGLVAWRVPELRSYRAPT